jgi:hypothetical protein
MVERDKVEDRAIFWLLQPSLLLQLERKLLEYKDHQFEHGYGIDGNLSFQDLVSHMRLLLNKRSKIIFCSKRKHKHEIAAILLEMKTGIKLFGDTKLKVDS